MTDNTPTPSEGASEMVEITQEDREAAAKALTTIGSTAWQKSRARMIRAGRVDTHPFAQAFARHRIAALATLPAAAPAASGDVPDSLPGHWDTEGGREIAAEYATKTRADLCHGDLSDFLVANRVFMASRNDLDLINWQTAAKERIRWLSTQLALSSAPQPPADHSSRIDLSEFCATAPLPESAGKPPFIAEPARRIIERLANAVTTMSREGTANFHAGCEAVAKDCLPLFKQLGLDFCDEGGMAFDEDDFETPPKPAPESAGKDAGELAHRK